MDARTRKTIEGLNACIQSEKTVICPDNCPYIEENDCLIRLLEDARNLINETEVTDHVLPQAL